MALIIYGYCINDNVEFRLNPPVLVNTLNGSSIKVRQTTARLLGFLLARASHVAISDIAIMTEVFEAHGLRCSRPRLWQAMHTLEVLLLRSGVSGEIFIRMATKIKGYSLSKLSVRVLLSTENYSLQV